MGNQRKLMSKVAQPSLNTKKNRKEYNRIEYKGMNCNEMELSRKRIGIFGKLCIKVFCIYVKYPILNFAGIHQFGKHFKIFIFSILRSIFSDCYTSFMQMLL